MCGIVGFQQKNSGNKEHVIGKMIRSIRHRGPDGEGFMISDETALGNVRLAIIDIDNGQQPMHSADGRYTIVYNGEIYNYLELRQQLVQLGVRLKTFSDTEVLLYTYIEFGRAALQRLNGMFAFAIYDRSDKSIFIARDHFGIKPLYYFKDQDHFIFGSEIKALLQHPVVKAEVDEDGIYEYLTFQMTLGEKTLFKDIYKLKPANYILIRDCEIAESEEYWHLDYTIDESRKIDSFSDELLVLLENSLSIQVRSDVPVGSYLSGGLDSSTVAVLASKNYYGQLKTFTGGFKHSPIYDESSYAHIVSKHINSEQFEIYPEASDFVDVFENLIYFMDEPGGGPGIFPQYMVSKLASEHVKVVLGGQGGDEIFGGYARYAVAYLEQCIKGAIFETQEEGQHVVTLRSIIDNLPLLKQYIPMIKRQFSSGLFDEMDKRYFNLIDRSPNLHHLYQPSFLQKRSQDKIFEEFSLIFNHPTTDSYFNKMTYYDIKTLLPTLLQIEDRMSMAVSLESRVPLLDKRIVELAARMPPTMKFASGKTKFMLSNAVRNVVPKEIIERKDKMGFPVPINEWTSGPLRSYILDIFNSQACKERGILKVDEVSQSLNKYGKFNRDIWGALNLEIWFRTFIDS